MWHHEGMTRQPKITDDELRRLKPDYEATLARLEDERDATMRAANAQGYSQTDIIKLTGYVRETVRRALKPEVKAAAKRARSKDAG